LLQHGENLHGSDNDDNNNRNGNGLSTDFADSTDVKKQNDNDC
jgi:hypothetical protein